MIHDTKYSDIEFACGVAESRVLKVEQELACYRSQVNQLKKCLEETEPGTKKYLALQAEYEEALDDEKNLECYVELVRAERNKLQAELRRIIDNG